MKKLMLFSLLIFGCLFSQGSPCEDAMDKIVKDEFNCCVAALAVMPDMIAVHEEHLPN